MVVRLTSSYICSAETTRSFVSIRVPITSSFSTSYDESRCHGWLSSEGRYLYVSNDVRAGGSGNLKTVLNAGIGGDALFVTIDPHDCIDQIARCLTGVGDRCEYLWFLLNTT